MLLHYCGKGSGHSVLQGLCFFGALCCAVGLQPKLSEIPRLSYVELLFCDCF